MNASIITNFNIDIKIFTYALFFHLTPIIDNQACSSDDGDIGQ